MSSPWVNAFKKSLKRPAFVIALIVLLLGAIGITAASTAMQLHFRKEAMPLRAKEGLAALPLQLGSWVAVPEAHTLNPDEEHVIWPFDGEYWRDELGFYRQVVSSKCGR